MWKIQRQEKESKPSGRIHAEICLVPCCKPSDADSSAQILGCSNYLLAKKLPIRVRLRVSRFHRRRIGVFVTYAMSGFDSFLAMPSSYSDFRFPPIPEDCDPDPAAPMLRGKPLSRPKRMRADDKAFPILHRRIANREGNL
jgi:hypothetical protein